MHKVESLYVIVDIYDVECPASQADGYYIYHHDDGCAITTWEPDARNRLRDHYVELIEHGPYELSDFDTLLDDKDIRIDDGASMLDICRDLDGKLVWYSFVPVKHVEQADVEHLFTTQNAARNYLARHADAYHPLAHIARISIDADTDLFVQD